MSEQCLTPAKSKIPLKPLLASLLTCILLSLTSLQAAHSAEPDAIPGRNQKTRVLLITGGCCHDYQNQKQIISESLSAKVGNIDWTILHYGSPRDVHPDVYRRPDWIQGYDLVIHNECFGGVEDEAFVQGIVDAHVRHAVPAMVIHCSMHSYRNSPAADSWRALLGVTSRRHEKSKHSLHVVATDQGKLDPVLKSMPPTWDTPNGELYIIEKVWPQTKVLATVHSMETDKHEPVIWTNQYKGVRVFGISLGHHNETMESPVWQSIVADGFRWSLRP